MLPNFCFGQGLSDLYTSYEDHKLFDTCMSKVGDSAVCCEAIGQFLNECPPTAYGAWDEPGIGRYTVLMLVEVSVLGLENLDGRNLRLACVSLLLPLVNLAPKGGVLLPDCVGHREPSFLQSARKNLPRFLPGICSGGWLDPLELSFSTQPSDTFCAHATPSPHSPSTFSCQDHSQPTDEDVLAEQERVERVIRGQGSAEDNREDILLVNKLKKVWRTGTCGTGQSKLAVNELSIGVAKGECFGLLGVNGAGKSTTFAMLTGEVPMSDGSATLEGYDVATEIRPVRQRMGYCPQ